MKNKLSKNSLEKVLMVSVLAAVVSFGLSGCGASGNKTNVELIQDMMESPALKAQELDETAPHQIGNRVPPENTIPNNFTPYKYKTDPEGAAKMANPIAGSMEKDVLIVGQKYFETNCMVCHGQKAAGNPESNVVKNMALKPPSLLTDKIRGWSDGQIYHVITQGQGVMGPYASHIPQMYRWQVVNYLRFLQKETK
jgi:mono/diheme cytochrome c family protein